MADAASSALTPSAAAKMCTKQPAVMPSPAITPAFAPARSEFVTMYSTSGPGVRFSSQPAAMNSSRCCASGMEEAPHGGDRAGYARGVDVEVGRETQAVQAGGQHAVGFEVLEQLGRAFACRAREIDEDDVRLRR